MINHNVLLQAARRFQYPLALLRLSTAGYRAPRRFLYASLLSREILPQRGIIVGNAFATTELRLYLLEPVTTHFKYHHDVQLDIFIDDLAFHAVRKSRLQVSTDLVNSVVDFVNDLEKRKFLQIDK